MQTESPNGSQGVLQFSLVEGWGLSPFEEQNILFDLHIYDQKTLPDWFPDEFDIPSAFMKSMTTGKYLFYLEPSVGLGGYIIAEKIEYKIS